MNRNTGYTAGCKPLVINKKNKKNKTNGQFTVWEKVLKRTYGILEIGVMTEVTQINLYQSGEENMERLRNCERSKP